MLDLESYFICGIFISLKTEVPLGPDDKDEVSVVQNLEKTPEVSRSNRGKVA